MKKQSSKRTSTHAGSKDMLAKFCTAVPPCSPARWVAFHVLNVVLHHEKEDAMEALREFASSLRLSDADRRLASTIVLSVLRHLLTIDYQIQQYLPSKHRKIDPTAHLLLRMIAAQRHYLDRVPSYAAVNDAVEIAKALSRKPRTVAFINAVGRRLAAQTDLQFPVNIARSLQLALRWSQPEWLVKRFLNIFGDAFTERLLAELNEEPRHAVRVNVLRITPSALAAEWAKAGIEAERGNILPESLLLKSSADLARALEHPSFALGYFYIQDEASQLVSHFVAPRPGERILDLCAAPGGKTTHLAELSRGQAWIDATDCDPKRLMHLKENISRLGTPNVRVLPYEEILAAVTSGTPGYDAVLVDAPCSALGTIRRHPEVRWRVTPQNVRRLGQQQRELLSLAAKLVRVGGRIVYATCSPLPEENEAIIRWFLHTHRNFVQSGALPPMPIEMPSQRDLYCTWPCNPEIDGFSVAVFSCRSGY